MTTELTNIRVSEGPTHLEDLANGAVETPDDKPTHPLDSENSKKRLRILQGWYQYEKAKQSVNRYQQAIDEDFYDHLQWSEEDAAVLRDRGQAPLVFNLIRPAVDWLIGTEAKTRIDYKILPRSEDDVDGAKTKTQLMKYVSDVNKTGYHRSRGFKEAVKAGVGWLESGIDCFGDGELLFTRTESWRNVLYDSHSVDPSLKDARYLFRWKWVDLDFAMGMFPDRKAALKKAAISADGLTDDHDDDLWYLGGRVNSQLEAPLARRTYITWGNEMDNTRARVKLIECQYRVPKAVKRMSGGEFSGKFYDEKNPAMLQAVQSGEVTLYDSIQVKMKVAIFTDGSDDASLCQDSYSPFKHNDFSLTPIWAYRRARDNAPYGWIRGERDPQEDYNKRSSKALWLLSSNRVSATKGAFDDVDEAREEASRADMFLLYNKGHEFKIETNSELAASQVALMERDHNLIQGDAGGITRENLGQQTNATSGRAIIARQEQGSMTTAELFDNYRFAIQIDGQKQLSLIEQFYSQSKVIRIVGDRPEKIEWLKINQYDQETGDYQNDVTKTQADFIVSEQDYRASLRQAALESLSDIVSKLPPEVSIQFLDLVFDMFDDLPQKEELVKRIRQVNGRVDPNAKLTPQEKQQMEADQRAKDEQAALQNKQAQLLLSKMGAEIRKLNAASTESEVKAVLAAIGQLGKTVTGSAALATHPTLAPIADGILKSSGFVDHDAPPIAPVAKKLPAPSLPLQVETPPQDAKEASAKET